MSSQVARVYSAIPYGYTGSLVTVEGDMHRGLPSFNLVGMANKTITEARERVRSAVTNSGFTFPDRKVTINLAPAALAKDGAHLDLPIAVVILILARALRPAQVERKLFVGELSLDGRTKPIRGIINVIETAKNASFTTVYLPRENLPLARLVTGINLIGISSLSELFAELKGIPYTPIVKNTQTDDNPDSTPSNTSNHSPDNPSTDTSTANSPQATSLSTSPVLLDHISGQSAAKRALTIAVAGHHNLLFTGPPGTGKTLLARTAAALLPPPSPLEQIEIAKLHSLSAQPNYNFTQRPFHSPHHTASAAAILGGGNRLQPGEISLAHRGILFLDELPEYPRNVLEALRQPLEDGQITLARANQHATYPANFILIATMNPCPCGYYGDPDHPCTCSTAQISAYRKRLSGPILDRIDLVVNVNRLRSDHFLAPATPSSSTYASFHAAAQALITAAHQRQTTRYQNPAIFNAQLTSPQITNFIHLAPDARAFLTTAADRLHLSARGYFKVLKVAQTIAYLDAAAQITPAHLSDALSYRVRSPAADPP